MKLAAPLALALLLASPATAAAPSHETDAERWLALVDAETYAESWSAAGMVFRQRTTKEAWIKAVQAARRPLGGVLSRKMSKEEQATSLPDMPDGEYSIIQFSTVFANKKTAIETVVLAHEPDGWKVDGYFVW